MPASAGTEHEKVKADMVFYETPKRRRGCSR